MITKLVNVKLKKSLAEKIKDFVCRVYNSSLKNLIKTAKN